MPISNPSTSVSTPTATTGSSITNTLSTTAAALVTSNTSRKGLTIFNNLNVSVFIDTANTVSNSAYWIKLDAGAFYEMPTPIYTGGLWAVTASGTGSLQVREFV